MFSILSCINSGELCFSGNKNILLKLSRFLSFKVGRISNVTLSFFPDIGNPDVFLFIPNPLWLIHFAEQQKLTQHCKTTIFQYTEINKWPTKEKKKSAASPSFSCKSMHRRQSDVNKITEREREIYDKCRSGEEWTHRGKNQNNSPGNWHCRQVSGV